MSELEKIVFDTDEGEEEFYVIDDTRINGVNYILVTDAEDPDAEEIDVLILKDISNILDGSGFEFAFRTAKEIRLYINAAYALAQNEGKTLSEDDYVNLMDEQLLQKILPKIHGNRKQIGNLLEKLESFCTEKSLSLSLAKIQKMKVRLENYQYASFI